MKSAKLEWCLNDLKAALKLLDEAINMFPDFPKLWMMQGQIYEQMEDFSKAFDAYNSGVSRNIMIIFYKSHEHNTLLDKEVSNFDSAMAVVVSLGGEQRIADQGTLGSRESPPEESEERSSVAGSGASGVACGHERHRERHDGESAAGVPDFRPSVGRIDIFGGEAAAEDQVRGRAEEVRTRSARFVGGQQAVLVGEEDQQVQGVVPADREDRAGSGRRLGALVSFRATARGVRTARGSQTEVFDGGTTPRGTVVFRVKKYKKLEFENGADYGCCC